MNTEDLQIEKVAHAERTSRINGAAFDFHITFGYADPLLDGCDCETKAANCYDPEHEAQLPNELKANGD